ncbi:MAG: four helix bundle protein [Nitrospirae bacterium]|nr:four helix bundle protein [Nitrospirota bacterium]
MAFTSFENMPVWKKGMELVEQIYAITEQLPKKEDYGLTSQLRRSALSVPGNIAEGFGRKHTKDKLRFYYNSRGSLAETKSHLLCGHGVGYFTNEQCSQVTHHIQATWKELNALIRALENHAQPQP